MMKHMLKWYFPLCRCSPPLLVLASNWFFHVCSCVHLRLGVDVCILKAISNAHTHFCCKMCMRQQHVKTRPMRECVLTCVTSLTHTAAALLKQRQIEERMWEYRSVSQQLDCLYQGCPNSVLKGQCPAEFRSNLPQHTCHEVSSMPSKSMISWFRCVWLGLELNSAGHRPSRTVFGHPWFISLQNASYIIAQLLK